MVVKVRRRREVLDPTKYPKSQFDAMESFSIASLVFRDVFLVQPRKFADPRGYSLKTFSRTEFAKLCVANDLD